VLGTRSGHGGGSDAGLSHSVSRGRTSRINRRQDWERWGGKRSPVRENRGRNLGRDRNQGRCLNRNGRDKRNVHGSDRCLVR
jgi:hypothetical protein